MKRIFVLTLLGAMLLGCGGGKKTNVNILTVGVDEFATLIVQDDVRLIDVRTPDEYAEGHLFGAENIDVKAADFLERIADINSTVAVYCRGGKRSLAAAEQLAANGCTVYNLDGGIMAWQKAGRPTTTEAYHHE